MNLKRSIATLEILLVFPATLFMLALFLRNVQTAPTSRRRPHTIWWTGLPPARTSASIFS
jgi:hypothetical protein